MHATNSQITLETPVPQFGNWTLLGPRDECQAQLHRSPFQFKHDLANHPLFQLDRLAEVAKEAARRRGDLYFDAGDVALKDKWGNIPIPDLSVVELFRRLETASAWIALKHVDTNPKYKAILDEFVDFVRKLAGPERAKLLLNPEMVIFIASPLRFTPFHFDAEVNFLAQVHGTKDLWVCDPSDRSITTEEEIERYYAISITAGNYKPAAEEVAMHFALKPGDGVHIPTHGAHWVKNHNSVSVSLSLNFEFPPSMYADVYRANHFLRRMGLSPRPPGRSAIVDRSKAALTRMQRSFKKRFGHSQK